MFPWNNGTVIEKLDDWKWYSNIIDFFQYMHAWNQGGIVIGTYNISLLKFLFCKKHSQFERMSDCNYSFIIQKGSFIKSMGATRSEN